MTEVRAFCQPHWDEVRATFDGPVPLNGLMFNILLVSYWAAKQDGLDPSDPEAVNLRMMVDAPLCCWTIDNFGISTYEVLKSQSVLPIKYRAMDIREGHMQHLMDTQMGS